MNYDFGKAKLKVELARIKVQYAELTLESYNGAASSLPPPLIRDATCRVERYRVKLRLREIEVERLTANQKGNLT